MKSFIIPSIQITKHIYYNIRYNIQYHIQYFFPFILIKKIQGSVYYTHQKKKFFDQITYFIILS